MAFKKPNLPKATEVEQFINKAVTSDYSALTLDELAHEYESIDQQSQMLKGRILLEARNRFKSDNEFGDWVVGVGLSDTSRQTRNVYMNLARFFQDRDMTGISLTAAYEISRPQNADIAEELYSDALLKKLPVSEVKEKIAQLKKQAGIALVSDENKKSQVFVLADELQTYKNSVLGDVKDLSNQDAIRVLKTCLKELQEKKDTHVQDAEVVTIQEPETTEISPASEDTGDNS
jgi:hypothetical protein